MDITEFANPNVPEAPTTTGVIEGLEGASKPLIAANICGHFELERTHSRGGWA